MKLVRVFPVVLLAFVSTRAMAWHLLEAEAMNLEYEKLDKNNRDVYAPQYTGRWQDRASLKWRISILEAVYWDNNIHTETIDTGQVKTVGWHWEAGVRLNSRFTIFEEHHSRHIMDESPNNITAFPSSSGQFPVENSVGIRVKLIEEKVGRGLFN